MANRVIQQKTRKMRRAWGKQYNHSLKTTPNQDVLSEYRSHVGTDILPMTRLNLEHYAQVVKNIGYSKAIAGKEYWDDGEKKYEEVLVRTVPPLVEIILKERDRQAIADRDWYATEEWYAVKLFGGQYLVRYLFWGSGYYFFIEDDLMSQQRRRSEVFTTRDRAMRYYYCDEIPWKDVILITG